MNNNLTKIIDCLLPRPCVNCNSKLLHFESFLCSECYNDLAFYDNNSSTNCLLIDVYKQRDSIFLAKSVLEYRSNNITAKLIHELKYFGNIEVVNLLSNLISKVLENNISDIDIITFVPLHPKKKKQRKYNQAELLASELGAMHSITVQNLLKRDVYNNSQTTKNKKQRLETITGAFSWRDMVRDKNILLVDDVITTGATTIECVKVLEQGNNKVALVSAAIATIT
jgi:competence protein ComFC